ncbi:hypothetical protein QZH41_006654 [Actinostola sp. cb2023]|nr:hypothetical protein QZH41_006654 [Actinostola sp. cb2023]
MCQLSMKEQLDCPIRDENMQELDGRFKRCTRDSPSSSSNQRKKVAKGVHRNILAEKNTLPVLDIPEDLIVYPKPKDKNADVEVKIDYPSKTVKKHITDDLDARIIRAISCKERDSILYDIFFKPGSGNDIGTMCSNMNLVNNVNARTTNVLDNLNHCKDFVNLETDAHITAATMKYFSMEYLDTLPQSFIPPTFLMPQNKESECGYISIWKQCCSNL